MTIISLKKEIKMFNCHDCKYEEPIAWYDPRCLDCCKNMAIKSSYLIKYSEKEMCENCRDKDVKGWNDTCNTCLTSGPTVRSEWHSNIAKIIYDDLPEELFTL